MPLRDLARRLAARLSQAVAGDDLFEQPGERPPAEPLAKASPGTEAAARIFRPGSADRPRPTAPEPAPPAAAAPPSAPPSPPAVSAAPEPPSAPAAAPASAATKPSRARGKAGAKAPASAPVRASRPAEGCVPVDLPGLRAALTPAGKPLVVNHWATWCEPCVDELPRLVRAAAGAGSLAEFLGVSWDLFDHPGDPVARAGQVAAFAESMGVGYPSVLYTGEPETLFEALGLEVRLVPQTFVIAPDGAVIWHKAGVLEHDDVFPLIAAVKAAARTP